MHRSPTQAALLLFSRQDCRRADTRDSLPPAWCRRPVHTCCTYTFLPWRSYPLSLRLYDYHKKCEEALRPAVRVTGILPVGCHSRVHSETGKHVPVEKHPCNHNKENQSDVKHRLSPRCYQSASVFCVFGAMPTYTSSSDSSL